MNIVTIPKEEVYICPYSIEEVENLYQYKVLRRSVMNELLWVKNMFIDTSRFEEEYYVKWKAIPIGIEINPDVFCETYGWTIPSWIEHCKERDLGYSADYMAQFCSGSYNDTIDAMESLNKLFKQVEGFKGFPEDGRLIDGYEFKVSKFYFNHGKKMWDDLFFKPPFNI